MLWFFLPVIREIVHGRLRHGWSWSQPCDLVDDAARSGHGVISQTD